MSELKTDALEDYNPFSDPINTVTTTATRPPAMLPPADTSSPPPYSNTDVNKDSPLQDSNGTLLASSVPVLTVAELQRRQAELDARAAQLDLREKQAQQREAWRMEHGYGTVEVPNWPPLPRWCCIKPCVRVDFNSDIPSQCRWMAMYAHYFWMAYSLILLLDVFGALAYLTTDAPPSQTGPIFGVAIVVFLLLTPASFFCWNRPLYKALSKNSSMQFCIFFPCFAVQIIIIFIQLLGIDYLGACGWINSLKVYPTHHAEGAFMMTIAALFSIAAGFAVYLIIRVHIFYRTSGASLRHAKQEIAQDVVAGGFAAVS